MMDSVFAKTTWSEALKEMQSAGKVFVPVREGDFFKFDLMREDIRPNFDFQNTRLSPKGLMFPQADRMFAYSLDDKAPDAHILHEAPKDFGPRTVVGIRPCDAYAFLLVKLNYDTPDVQDPLWLKRFEATTLVGLGCTTPCSSCFCTTAGSGPFSRKGLDVLLYDLGESYLARPLTPKGEALLARTTLGRPAESAQSAAADALEAQAGEKVSARIETDRLKEKAATALFEAPFWEEVAFACLNCGTCTYLCPTCWCFDIQDEVYNKEGDRIRIWDACMFPLFTLHGSGHNPRAKKFQRVRQRFMHKLKYYVDKYGEGIACVGCGRCVQFCPVNIDIRRVAQRMNAS